MATDPYLLDRLRNSMQEKSVEWIEKKMFGGHCFMVDDKMCFGTFQNGLMVRIDPEEVEDLLGKIGATQMMQKNRVMKGYLHIKEEGYDTDDDLDFWVGKCLAWNPSANRSKKRK